MNRRQLLGRAAALCGMAALLPQLAEFGPVAEAEAIDGEAARLGTARITDARRLLEPTAGRIVGIPIGEPAFAVKLDGAAYRARYWD